MTLADGPSITTLIAGVGGQGVVLAGGVLAEAALLAGYDVRQSEMHGLSQRFGSVSCQIRIGAGLYSTHRGHGAVDLLLSLEVYEAYKQLPFLRPQGVALVNRLWRKPMQVKPGLTAPLANREDPRMEMFSGTELTQQAECPRSLNFFMLGVLSTRLEIGETHWAAAIASSTSGAMREVNQEMFAAGRRIAARSEGGRPRRWLGLPAAPEGGVAMTEENKHSVGGNLR